MIRVYNTTFILIFSLLLNCGQSYSQSNTTFLDKFELVNKLPVSTVYTVYQDSKGFLWLGTVGGLLRYDGYKYKEFKYDQENDKSLNNTIISSLFEDEEGNLCIGTRIGLSILNRATEEFEHYSLTLNDTTNLGNRSLWNFYNNNDNPIWKHSNGKGLFKPVLGDNVKPSDINSLLNNDLKDSLSMMSFYLVYSAILKTKGGNIWIGTLGGGLIKLKKETGEYFHYLNHSEDTTSLSDNRVLTLYEDKIGDIWIGTYGGGLNRVVQNETDNPTFVHYINETSDLTSINDSRVYSIYEDNFGDLWIGTHSGLNKFNRENFQFERFDMQSVWSICQDNSGVLWIGTDYGGLLKLNVNKLSFKHYKNEPENLNSLNGNIIFLFCEGYDNEYWIISDEGGLNKFSRDKESFNNFGHIPFDGSDPGILPTYTSLIQDNAGQIWIGTKERGLFKCILNDSRSSIISVNNYKHKQEDSTGLGSNFIWCIYEDDDGLLWIGTDSGIDQLTPNEKVNPSPSFIHIKNISNDSTSLHNNGASKIIGDDEGNIWIIGDEGIVKFNKETKQCKYLNKELENISLALFTISTLYIEESGIVWAGTDKGLVKVNKELNKIDHYSKKDGLSDNAIWGVLEDDYGNLWISTNKGLSKFNPVEESFINFTEKDGLQNDEFNERSCLRSQNGEMFFGGINGFNLFHPDSIKDNTHIPPVVITDFQLNNISVPVGYDTSTNRSILEYPITETKEIELNYDDKVFALEFAALDFHMPEKNKYAYMMENFENDWNYTDASRRLVTYTNLDPGDYEFRVIGSNDDGYWNEEGASIKITILPPWWATTWAYIIYAIILLNLIYFTWKLQLKRIRIKNDYEKSKFEAEKMHEVDDMKSRFFANISHEFRTPLTLIFGPAKDIMEDCDDAKAKQKAGIIKRNASKLYGLVNQLLDLSKLEAGKMKLEASDQNIIPLLKGLVLAFTSLAERKKITLNFNTIEENLNVYIDKDKVEKIVNNLLSNAFKFTTEGGKIDFIVEKMIEDAEIRIADNGIGIAKERMDKIFDRFYQVDGSQTRESEGTGIGLALTKELVELHKGKLKVESKEGEGTTFTVLLPLGKEHLNPEEIVGEKTIEEPEVTIEEPELIPEKENRKEKTDIDILLETDKPLLLIVEDNSDVRKYIVNHLEDEYRIQEAVDGEDGLAQALNHIPDLIISDVMMPKMDGFELCDKLKSNEKTSHIPIIMLTAKATSQDKIEGYETGADDYIMKPFDATELKVRIKNLIEIRKKLQDKFSSDDYGIPKDLSSIDEQFMKRVLQVINEHISEEEFNIEQFCSELGLSDVQTYRKLKALTGKSPSSFIRSVRLSKAKKMLKEKSGNISEIAYSVGFGSPSYFTRCFKEEYGHPPSDL